MDEHPGARPGAKLRRVRNGRIVIREGRLTTIDLPVVLERHNRLARELVSG